MIKYLRSIAIIAALTSLAACSPQGADMTAEDFMQPENANALAKTLASCTQMLSGDRRAATCKAANSAKFALDAKEIGRIRREQIARQNAPLDGGTTVVERSEPSRLPSARATPTVSADRRVAEQ